jgi:hypothetical protein
MFLYNQYKWSQAPMNKIFIAVLLLAALLITNTVGGSSYIALGNNSTQSILYATPSGSPNVLTWKVSPWAAPADGKTKVIITSTVNDPNNDVSSVTIDLSRLGGGVNAALYDDGVHSDGSKQDGVYGLVVTIPKNVPTGEIPLNLTATDSQGNQTVVYLGTFALLTPTHAPWPASLPNYLGWGTGDKEWEQSTGLPWNYASAFLTWTWQSWGDSYVTKYVTDAWTYNEIPILTFDMLLGSASCNGLDELNCDFAHLQDSTIMQGYFDRVTAAASQAAGNKPVIFHIESDASAYMQRYSIDHAGQNGIVADDPNTIPTQSMNPAYPNTYAGALQRMVDIIHTQAPNALVALHARTWATGLDVAGSTDPNLDVADIGRRIAFFLSQAGGTHLDLLLTDWKVWDAGTGLSPWWDVTNRVLPNFNRMLYWQNQIVNYSNLPLVLWKVPAGNMSLDNTCQHYQDNRVDYAFEHPTDLLNAGIIGVVVGASTDCRTLPSTDNNNILNKGATFFAQPSTPASFTAAPTDLPGQVILSWLPSTEFDVVRYKLYIGRSPNNLNEFTDVQLQTSLILLLPNGGTWYLSVTAVDAYGLESPLAAPVMVKLIIAPYQLMLPTILH